MSETFATLKEAAELLGKSTQTLRRMIKKDEIKHKRMKTPQGFHYVIPRSELPSAEPVKQEEKVEEKPPIQVLYNSPIQNVEKPKITGEKNVLINQHSVLTSQSPVEPIVEAQNEAFDKILEKLEENGAMDARFARMHDEKMGLILVVERLQTLLEKERRRPRSFLAHVIDWWRGA
jgi:excisionase family DNA binding protein